MTVRTRAYDVADYLTDPARVTAYLGEVFETGDAVAIAAALGDVARAKGMTDPARDAGLTRAEIYQSPSENGNPRLSTLPRVIRAMGVRLAVTQHQAVA